MLKHPHLTTIERRRIVTPGAVKMRLHRLEYPEPWLFGQNPLTMLTNAACSVQQYPDYPPFISKVVENIGQPAERIVLGAGIEEFIRALFMLCDGAMVTPLPTCAMHQVYAQVFRTPVVWLKTDPRETAEPFLHRVIGACKSGVGVLLLANPGQPVQTYLTPAELGLVAARCMTLGITLAIDEAYHGFGSETAMPLVDAFPNVLVLRTFSKAMGLAGARIGYAVGQAPLISYLDAVRQSGEVSSLSMSLAAWTLDHLDRVVGWRIESVIAGRELMLEAVPHHVGLEVYATFGNSVLIDCQTSLDALSVTAELARRGILIRHVADLDEGQFIMVTCGREPMMEAFMTEFRGAWGCRNSSLEPDRTDS